MTLFDTKIRDSITWYKWEVSAYNIKIKTMNKIKIVIAEDHQMFRAGVVALLNNSKQFEVLGEAQDGVEAVKLVKELKPDVVLMDIALPTLDGVEASQKILQHFPKTKILALTLNDDEHCILKMLKAGVRGYVLKNGTMDELKMAIKILSEGSSYFSKDVSPKLFTNLERREKSVKRVNVNGTFKKVITIREFEILKLVAEEFSNREIADVLFISPRTVETHKRNLIQKLKVKNTVGLVKYYLGVSKEINPVSKMTSV